MSAKPHTFGDLADAMSERLEKLSYFTQLCAFAAEARRTLNEIQDTARLLPSFSTTLEQHIEARNEWNDHPDHLGVVLKFIAQEINDLNELVNDREVHDAINCP